MEQMSFCTGCNGLEDTKLDSVSMAIGIRSVFKYDWAGRVYKSACHDIEQRTDITSAFSPIG